MAELRLPPGPTELLEAVRKPLGHHLGGEHHLIFGGGTALAARWAHRHSTDVDLYASHRPFRRMSEFDLIRDLDEHTAGRARLYLDHDFAQIDLPGGHVSVDTSFALTAQPRSRDTIHGTAVGAYSNAEILARKLVYRMLGQGRYVSRDLYDLAVGRHKHPAALKVAFNTVHPSNLFVLQRGLDELDQASIDRDSRPLLQPAFPHDAANSLVVLRHLVAQEIERRNPPKPPRSVSHSPTR